METKQEHECMKINSKLEPITERGYKMKRTCKVCGNVLEEDAKISTFEGFIRAWVHDAVGKKTVLGNYHVLKKEKQIVYIGSGRNTERGKDILALKLKDGRVIGNASRLERCGSYSRGNEAPAQRVMFALNMAMIPFNVFDEAKLDIQKAKVIEQGKEEDFLLPKMEWSKTDAMMIPVDARAYEESVKKLESSDNRIILKQERAKITIDSRTKSGSFKMKDGYRVRKTVSGWACNYMNKTLMENRHFVGAMLLSVSNKYFIFDIDRVEIKNYRFNPFLTQIPKEAKTLAEAYEILKPKEVVKAEKKHLKVLRQGEWFFIPSDKKKVPEIPKLPEALQKKLKNKPSKNYFDLYEYSIEFDFEDNKENKSIISDLMGDYNYKKVGKKYRKNIISRTKDYVKDCENYSVVLEKKKVFDSKFNFFEYGGELKAGDNRPNTVGKLFTLNGVNYVKGKVEHTGREHETIELKKWYIAIPNTAIQSFTIVGDID